MGRDWRTFNVTDEWINQCKAALTPELAEEFRKQRGFPNVERMLQAVTNLGWCAELHKWVIPVYNIHGKAYHAKAWSRSYEPYWVTIGNANAMSQRSNGYPIGHLLDLKWVIDNHRDDNWLWITAGEFDMFMLRCNKWLATTSVFGETGTLTPEQIINEFGGIETTHTILSALRGIVFVYDVDSAGHSGMRKHSISFDQAIDQIKKAEPQYQFPDTFHGVRAVDLRQHPQWKIAGEPDSWDLSDLAKWSLANHGGASAWLREAVETSSSGWRAVSIMFDFDVDESANQPSMSDVILPTGIHYKTFEELLRFGIDYAHTHGESRNQGMTHMAILAARSGWTFSEIWDEPQNAGAFYDLNKKILLRDLIPKIFSKVWPNKPAMPESELRRTFESMFVNYTRHAALTDDVSNVLRLFHYYSWLRYHPLKGWLWFDNGRWLRGKVKATECATKIGNHIDEEANVLSSNNAAPKQTIDSLRRHGKASRNYARISAMLKLASEHPLGRPGESDESDGWDANEWHLGVVGGVFDLRTGVMLNKNDSMLAYCSMSCNGSIIDLDDDEAVANAGVLNERQLWLECLKQWQPDITNQEMLQEVFGTALSGRHIQKLFVFESSGRSGKSACLGAMLNALGSYGTAILGSVASTKSSDNSKSSAISGLSMRRFCRIDELGSSQLDLEFVKMITGEGSLQGRAMRQDWTSIPNTGTYVGTSNGPLNLSNDVSEALRGRLVVVQWPRTFVDPSLYGRGDYRDDPDVFVENNSLTSALQTGPMATVVLSWAYAGLKRVLGRSADVASLEVKLSPTVVEKTEVMWSEANLIRAYFEESGVWRKPTSADYLAVEGFAGTEVATEGLRRNMHAWALNVDREFADELERGPKIMGQMLRRQRARGFEVIEKTGHALWMGDRKQVRAWRVPYVYVGEGR